MKLQPYNFTVEIIPGKENIVADSLSRIPWPTVKIENLESNDDFPDDEPQLSINNSNPDFEEVALPEQMDSPISLEEVQVEQATDPVVAPLDDGWRRTIIQHKMSSNSHRTLWELFTKWSQIW